MSGPVSLRTVTHRRIEESITIGRRPEEVFAFFDDRRNASRWMDAVVTSRWVDDREETELGRRGRMVMHAPRLTEFEDEVVDYEPGRRVGHRSVSDSMVFRTACHADPTLEGTRAILERTAQRRRGISSDGLERDHDAGRPYSQRVEVCTSQTPPVSLKDVRASRVLSWTTPAQRQVPRS
jgi:hypothetical protein